MPRPSLVALLPFLLLLFFGTLCNAMIVPFMGFYLIEGLGRDPWAISIYSGLAVCLTVLANRFFANRIDAGQAVFPMIGIAAAGYVLANVALSISPAFWTVLTIGALGFGVSSSAVSTMFSLGGSMAERHGVERPRFNAYMRATTSTAWMVGPAISFLFAHQFGETAVFKLGATMSLVWLAFWWWSLPHDIQAPARPPKSGADQGQVPAGLWLAGLYVFLLSTAHGMTFTALPLFYVQEVGLPGFAPGTAFSVKTFVEIFAIFSTPFLIARFGLRASLLATTCLAVLVIQILAAVSSFPQMIAGAALEGLYYGLYASLGISFVQSFAPDRPARATAIYWNMLMISGLLGGPIAGLIAQMFDFRTVIHVASATAFVSFLVLLVGSIRARRASSA